MSTHNRSGLNQAESGKAWEYGIAHKFAELLNVPLTANSPQRIGESAYNSMPSVDRANVSNAAGEAVKFLLAYEERLHHNPQSVIMQSDALGKGGDVRDIIITTATDTIGISAKHRNADLKHPRLSPTIDFVHEWIGQHATSDYWADVEPIFNLIETSSVKLWRDLPDKHSKVYVPLLRAFIAEVKRQCAISESEVPQKLMRYMIGRYDFYKIMKENGDVCLQSFNMDKTLKWGNRVPIPMQIINLEMKPKSQTTALMFFDGGWSLSLRLHNAETRLVPSLKFAIQLVGQPTALANHIIPYG